MFQYLIKGLNRKLPLDQLNESIKYGRLTKNLKYLFPSVKKTWRIGVIATFFLIISSLLSWPLPMVMRYLIDNVLLKKNLMLLAPVVILLVSLNITIFITNLLQKYFNTKFTEEAVFDLRRRLLNKTFSLPKSFFDKNHSGYIISRISSDVEGVRYFLSGTVTQLFIEILRFIGGTVFLFYLEWRIAFPVLITLPFAFVLTRFFARKNYAVSHIRNEVTANLNASYTETISSAQLIKSFSKEEQAINSILVHVKEKIQLFYESTALNVLNNGINKLMPSIAKLTILIIGSYWIITGYWEIGTLIAYFSYLSYVYSPVTSLSLNIRHLQSARATLDRVASIFDMVPEDNLAGGINIDRLTGLVEFKNVSFYYEKGNNILDHISMKVNPGEHWAVVGKSGIGKTTLISLLMRFYKPQEGSIIFDSKDVSEINLKSLRKRIGFVSQNIQLISGTIEENLKYGNQKIGLDKIIDITKKVEIHSFIDSLPEKYDTLLCEGGVNLSEGQKQRISLARTLLKDADIIILDEPTSALDNATENSICNMIENYFSEKTIFIIAHRPETIKIADNIILLREKKPPLIGKLKALENEPEIKETLGT